MAHLLGSRGPSRASIFRLRARRAYIAVAEVRQLWTWYSAEPHGRELRDALFAIASAGAVVWTGGLIAFQIRGIQVELGSALEYLRFAFVAPLVALIASPAVVRTVALIFVLFYIRRVYVHFKFVDDLIGRFLDYDSVQDHAWHRAMARAWRFAWVVGTTAIATLVACIAVFLYPSHLVVSWSSLLTLVGGLQFISAAVERPPNSTKSIPGRERSLRRVRRRAARG
jgi:hypothetical protein